MSYLHPVNLEQKRVLTAMEAENLFAQRATLDTQQLFDLVSFYTLCVPVSEDDTTCEDRLNVLFPLLNIETAN